MLRSKSVIDRYDDAFGRLHEAFAQSIVHIRMAHHIASPVNPQHGRKPNVSSLGRFVDFD
ncbi:hypothetical protein D3C73_1590100 [compost metagenome]